MKAKLEELLGPAVVFRLPNATLLTVRLLLKAKSVHPKLNKITNRPRIRMIGPEFKGRRYLVFDVYNRLIDYIMQRNQPT